MSMGEGAPLIGGAKPRNGEWAMGRMGESGRSGLSLSALERRTLLCPLRLLRQLCPLSRHARSPLRPIALSPFRLIRRPPPCQIEREPARKTTRCRDDKLDHRYPFLQGPAP